MKNNVIKEHFTRAETQLNREKKKIVENLETKLKHVISKISVKKAHLKNQ